MIPAEQALGQGIDESLQISQLIPLGQRDNMIFQHHQLTKYVFVIRIPMFF